MCLFTWFHHGSQPRILTQFCLKPPNTKLRSFFWDTCPVFDNKLYPWAILRCTKQTQTHVWSEIFKLQHEIALATVALLADITDLSSLPRSFLLSSARPFITSMSLSSLLLSLYLSVLLLLQQQNWNDRQAIYMEMLYSCTNTLRSLGMWGIALGFPDILYSPRKYLWRLHRL